MHQKSEQRKGISTKTLKIDNKKIKAAIKDFREALKDKKDKEGIVKKCERLLFLLQNREWSLGAKPKRGTEPTINLVKLLDEAAKNSEKVEIESDRSEIAAFLMNKYHELGKEAANEYIRNLSYAYKALVNEAVSDQGWKVLSKGETIGSFKNWRSINLKETKL